MDPVLQLLGRGRPAPVDEGALGAEAGDATADEPDPADLAGSDHPDRASRVAVETAVGKPVDSAVIAGVAGFMFLLVVMRMAGVVGAHKQAVAREQVLRLEAAELVGAPARRGIYTATIRAVTDLVGAHVDDFSVVLAMADPMAS